MTTLVYILSSLCFVIGMAVFVTVGLLALHALWAVARRLLRGREIRTLKKIHDDYVTNGTIGALPVRRQGRITRVLRHFDGKKG